MLAKSVAKRFELGGDDVEPDVREHKKLCAECPITLSDVHVAFVLDDCHIFEAHALLKHFMTQALARGIPSLEWTNPMTNAPVKSAWYPPAPIQTWIAQTSAAGSSPVARDTGYRTPRVYTLFGQRGYLFGAIHSGGAARVRGYDDTKETEKDKKEASLVSGREPRRRVSVTWRMVNTTLLLSTWSNVSGSCTTSSSTSRASLMHSRVWGALGRFLRARDFLAGIPLYYDGPLSRKGQRNIRDRGVLIMADGTHYKGVFDRGTLCGIGEIHGPSSDVLSLRSNHFVRGSVRGVFRMKFVNGTAGNEGMRLRAVGAHSPPENGRPRLMGAFRIYCKRQLVDASNQDESDDENRTDRRDGDRRDRDEKEQREWWSDPASFDVRFVPFKASSKTLPCIPVPSTDSQSPTSGTLTVCENIFDPQILRSRRFQWSGPVHFYARPNLPTADETFDLESSVFVGADGFRQGGASACRIRPAIVPLDSECGSFFYDRLVVTPAYAPHQQTPSVTEHLQTRVKELFVQANRAIRMFFSACEATLWTKVRMTFEEE